MPEPSSVRRSGDRRGDPRRYQIAVLSILALYGLLALDLEIRAEIAGVLLACVLGFQYLFGRWLGLAFDWRSPLISGLSLCLLLRTTSLAVAVLAAFVTIAGKFLVRRRGKHVFNPSALALVVVVLFFDDAWVSPGQWGSVALFGFLAAGLGMLVVYRAARSDVSLAFLAAWGAVVFGRALWLGDPPAIPLHQISSGALLLFAFFMISDPKTTPDSRPGRILFAGLVALGAGAVQFGLYRANGPLYALVAVSLLVPLIDRALPGGAYSWHRPGRPSPQRAAAVPAVPARPVPLRPTLAPVPPAAAVAGRGRSGRR